MSHQLKIYNKSGKTNAKKIYIYINTGHGPTRSVCLRSDCVTVRPVQGVSTWQGCHGHREGSRVAVWLWLGPLQRDLLRYRQSWHCGRQQCCPTHLPGADRNSSTSLRNHEEHRSHSSRQRKSFHINHCFHEQMC